MTKGHVVLERTWGRHFGVRRSGGMYRIAHWELMQRLKEFQQAPMERGVGSSTMPSGLAENESPLEGVIAVEGHPHFVGFYETEVFLVDSVRDFLASGLVGGGVAIVVATDAHRDVFDRALVEAGIDLDEVRRCGRFIVLDASEVLAKFMVEGMLDAMRFRATIGELISQAMDRASDVRIYGEMVAVLWERGDVAAAIALEDLWSDLATSYPFSLLCAYPMRFFDTDARAEEYRRICGRHSKVLFQG